MNPVQVEQKNDHMDIKEQTEKAKPKRERKEYMRKYYQDHRADLLSRSNKRYIPKKKKNIETEKTE